jgi:hypothetical protein
LSAAVYNISFGVYAQHGKVSSISSSSNITTHRSSPWLLFLWHSFFAKLWPKRSYTKPNTIMKKICLTLAGTLFIALTAVNAQEQSDKRTKSSTESSTNYRKSTDTDKTESGTQGQTETIQGKSGTQGQYGQDQNRQSVVREDLPDGLVQTLNSNEYRGWENATIYRDNTSEDYMLVLQDNGEVKTFYFDKEGKTKTQPGMSGTSGTTGTQSQYGTQDRTQSETTGTQKQSQSQYGTKDKSNKQSGTSGQTSAGVQTTQPSQQSNAWRAEDRVIIVSDDIPSSLRITLDDDKYKGWENSTMYRNRKTNEYMIEIRDGSNAKVYYFDKDGKIINNTGQ